jgi:hypothetical protein
VPWRAMGCLMSSAMLAAAGVVVTPSPTAADPSCFSIQHCYSRVVENDDGPYTGVRDSRWVIDLDVGASVVYATMWLIFSYDDCTNNSLCWIELGTEYSNHTTKTFGYLCIPTSCSFLFHTTQYTSVGSHNWKIDRNPTTNTTYDMYMDGYNWYSRAGVPYTSGVEVHAGLEAYNVDVTVETHAYYNLRYKKGNANYQDWSGKDDQSPIEWPMCGQWHLPTSWWAGSHDTCA